MVSRQAYGLDEPDVRSNPWDRLGRFEAEDRNLRGSAIDYFGSLICLGENREQSSLDREPEPAGTGSELGPPVCALSDAMLRRYARRSGVNWSARTILGGSPLFKRATDLIHLRFPDWSVWSLPLMAHEFGHVVAFGTQEFMDYHRMTSEKPPPSRPGNWGSHLHELFADIFATFVLGPAFACAAIVQEFSLTKAYLIGNDHPAADERVGVILWVLDQIGAGFGAAKRPSYSAFVDWLRRAWQQTSAAAGAGAPRDEGYVRQTRECAEVIYTRWVQPIYGLGVSYTEDRWGLATELAKQLGRRTVLDRAAIEELAALEGVRVTLDDLLNGLWYARLVLARSANDRIWIDRISYEIGAQFAGD